MKQVIKYKFRLVFYHSQPGFFRVDEASVKFEITDGLCVEIFPRNSDLLSDATEYHIDSGDFDAEDDARTVGEKVRQHLRMLNCILNLGLSIPIKDGNSGSSSEGIKEKVRAEGGELLDTMIGLHVFPDDERHFEHVMSGELDVYPSEPLYVLNALKDTWLSTFKLSEAASEALEILNISVHEMSPKVKFLTTYLAMERLIKREMRSKDACKLIDELISFTKESDLPEGEEQSLIGSLGYLKEQSFSSAFRSYAKRITSPREINGIPIQKFVSECIEIRNKIAHNASTEELKDIEEYTNYLREMVLSVLWTKYKLPDVSVHRPADTVSVEKLEYRMM